MYNEISQLRVCGIGCLAIVGRFARQNLIERHRRHETGPAAPRARMSRVAAGPVSCL
jgi:hypothetical protein